MRIRFGRILCATDLSECSNRALPYAAVLAKRLGGEPAERVLSHPRRPRAGRPDQKTGG